MCLSLTLLKNVWLKGLNSKVKINNLFLINISGNKKNLTIYF